MKLLTGDCVDVMQSLPPNSVDAIVCDPPYGLEFMGKEWDKLGDVRQPGDPTLVKSPGPMGRQKVRYGGTAAYRSSGVGTRQQAWHEQWAVQALRVAKPGAHLVAFGGTRTSHRLVSALEDAGWEIRDGLMWLYGAGFPKSYNLEKHGDYCTCEKEESDTTSVQQLRDDDGTTQQQSSSSCEVSVLQPTMQLNLSGQERVDAMEPCKHARQKANGRLALARSKQSIVEGRRDVETSSRKLPQDQVRTVSIVGQSNGTTERLRRGAPTGDGATDRSSTDGCGSRTSSKPRSTRQPAQQLGVVAVEQGSQDGGVWPICPRCGKPVVPSGLGTALKPAWEPIVLARKPLEGTVAQNVKKYGTGALNIDACRIGTDNLTTWATKTGRSIFGQVVQTNEDRCPTTQHTGRWPANVVLDPEAGQQLDDQSGIVTSGAMTHEVEGYESTSATGFLHGRSGPNNQHGDTGGASRFFYCAKASTAEREEGLNDFGLGDRKTPMAGRGQPGLKCRSCGKWKASGNPCTCKHPDFEPVPFERREVKNSHPTVKPVALMRWLCLLVTPPGGTVLDPFVGSGTTGIAARLCGFDFIGIDKTPEYVSIAEARIAAFRDYDTYAEHPTLPAVTNTKASEFFA